MHHIGRNGGTLHVRRVPITYMDRKVYVIEIHIVWCGCPFLTQHLESTGVMYDSDVCDFQLVVNYWQRRGMSFIGNL